MISLFTEVQSTPILFKFQHRLNALTNLLLLVFAYFPWPNATYELNGNKLNYTEFWLSGMAPSFLAFNILVLSICFGTMNHRRWALWGVFIYWSAIIAFLSFYSILGFLIGASIIVIWALFLFRNQKIQLYFAPRNS